MDQNKTNWWENFFYGIALDFWRAAVSDEQTRAEAEFIQKQLQLSAGAKILDVPCGNGRISLELASRGFNLTGVDIASEFIEEARARSAERNLEIAWLNQEMRDLPWSEDFDGLFCFGNSFAYLDDQGNSDFLQAVSRTLKPQARFVIDAPAAAECLLPSFEEQGRYELGGITLLIDRRYNHEQGRVFIEYTFMRDGKTETRPSSQRIYTYRELVKLLAEAGFEINAAYSSLNEDLFKLGSKRLLLICTKR
jgi:SAM-dependent methyltransferase